jgi:hypothetical protein
LQIKRPERRGHTLPYSEDAGVDSQLGAWLLWLAHTIHSDGGDIRRFITNAVNNAPIINLSSNNTNRCLDQELQLLGVLVLERCSVRLPVVKPATLRVNVTNFFSVTGN